MNAKPIFLTILRIFMMITLIGGILSWPNELADAATQVDIHGPEGSGKFGSTVTVLPNGNFLVLDPAFTGWVGGNAAALYLFNGGTSALISTLVIPIYDPSDIHELRLKVLSNGNFLLSNSSWNNSDAEDVGLVI